MLWLGLGAAVLAPLTMTIGFIVWDQTWKGSAVALNIFKCSLATFLFIITISIIGHPSAGEFLSASCGMLLLSSLLGIVVGDVAWLQALQLLGARRVILVDSVKPFLASILGYFILGESMTILGCVGMFITIVGVVIVSFENSHDESSVCSELKEESNNGMGGVGFSAAHSDEIDDERGTALSPIHSEYDAKEQDTPSSRITVQSCDESEIVNESFSASNIAAIGECSGATQSPMHFINGTENSIGESNVVTQSSVSKTLSKGYGFAVFNVIFDAYGAVLTKQYGVYFNGSEINLIRFGFAAVLLGTLASSFKLYSMFWGYKKNGGHDVHYVTKLGAIISTTEDISRDIRAPEIILPNSYGESLMSEGNNSPLKWYEFPAMSKIDWLKIAIGVVFVTYMSTSLFYYALFELKLGLCLTLTSLGPIFSIPLVYAMKNEKTSLRACGGSLLSFAGVAMLCLSEK